MYRDFYYNKKDLRGIDENISTNNTPIVNDFEQYFSRFNTKKVLILTDEDIESDLRVQSQILALKRLTKDITLMHIGLANSYSEKQKNVLKRKICINLFKNVFLFVSFAYVTKKMMPNLVLRTKAKQGIFNDNNNLFFKRMETKDYSLVVCNNLITARAIKLCKETDYVYDSHELEVFRNRKKQSLERSFHVYLQERKIIKKIKNIMTISRRNASLLSKIHGIDIKNFDIIYNQNFEKKHIFLDGKEEISRLFVYIGRVEKNRGLNDIIFLTKQGFKVLLIACNYEVEDLEYVIRNSNQDNLVLFKGMDYQEFLLDNIRIYSQVYFLTLIAKNSVSYQNALPNKFFQAHALGLPIIAYNDTYLSDIVEKHACGLLFDEDFLKRITTVTASDYNKMRSAMTYGISKSLACREL